jgi:hypothetical protein
MSAQAPTHYSSGHKCSYKQLEGASLSKFRQLAQRPALALSARAVVSLAISAANFLNPFFSTKQNPHRSTQPRYNLLPCVSALIDEASLGCHPQGIRTEMPPSNAFV